MLQHHIIPVTAFQQNCTLLWCDETRQAAIIDPGGDPEAIIAAVTKHNLEPKHILLTHGHLDHVGAAPDIAAHYHLPITGPHRDDEFWFKALRQQSQRFGLPAVSPFMPDQWVNEGDLIQVGYQVLSVYHTPGHTPGHVIFYSPSAQLAQVGDVLFAGSIGRTDLQGGNYDALVHSIETKLWPLGKEVVFIPGHGPLSTFEIEQRTNPYVGVNATRR